MTPERQAQRWLVQVFGSLRAAAEFVADLQRYGTVRVSLCPDCGGDKYKWGKDGGMLGFCNECRGTGLRELPGMGWKGERKAK